MNNDDDVIRYYIALLEKEEPVTWCIDNVFNVEYFPVFTNYEGRVFPGVSAVIISGTDELPFIKGATPSNYLEYKDKLFVWGEPYGAYKEVEEKLKQYYCLAYDIDEFYSLLVVDDSKQAVYFYFPTHKPYKYKKRLTSYTYHILPPAIYRFLYVKKEPNHNNP